MAPGGFASRCRRRLPIKPTLCVSRATFAARSRRFIARRMSFPSTISAPTTRDRRSDGTCGSGRHVAQRASRQPLLSIGRWLLRRRSSATSSKTQMEAIRSMRLFAGARECLEKALQRLPSGNARLCARYGFVDGYCYTLKTSGAILHHSRANQTARGESRPQANIP